MTFRIDCTRLAGAVLACLLFLVGIMFAQDVPPSPGVVPTRLTLEMATEILLARNPIILRERQNIVAARGDVVSASRLPNPELDLSSESYPLFENSPGPFFNRQEGIVKVGQTIETAGKRRKRTAVAQQDVAVAESSLQDTIRQLKLEFRGRYYGVILAKAQHELATQILSQYDEILKLNEARYKQGEVSGLDFTRLQTERLRFFNDVVEARLQLRNAKTALLELLGADDVGADLDVTESLDYTPFEVVLADLQREAEQARADLLAQRQRLEREGRELTFQKSLGIPNITPSFGYKRDFGLNTVAVGISLPLPLFNRNQGSVARAVAILEQQRHELQRVQLQVRRDIQQAYQGLLAQRERVLALQSTYVPSARRARDIAQASYRLGALDLIGFLDAERSYRETVRAYNQSLFDYRLAIFILQAAVGKEL